jgi:hypothetical protein
MGPGFPVRPGGPGKPIPLRASDSQKAYACVHACMHAAAAANSRRNSSCSTIGRRKPYGRPGKPRGPTGPGSAARVAALWTWMFRWWISLIASSSFSWIDCSSLRSWSLSLDVSSRLCTRRKFHHKLTIPGISAVKYLLNVALFTRVTHPFSTSSSSFDISDSEAESEIIDPSQPPEIKRVPDPHGAV